MAADGRALKKRHDQRVTKRQSNWEQNWELLAQYLLPRKAGITATRMPGERKTERLFDSTAPHAAEILSFSLGSVLFPVAQRAFSLLHRQRAVSRSKEVFDWLEELAIRSFLTITQSKSYLSESGEVDLDTVIFGTGACLLDEAPPLKGGAFGGVRFKSIPVGKYTIDENGFGQVDVLSRELEMSGRAAGMRWPDLLKDSQMKDKIEAKPEDPVTILHVVEPRPMRNVMRGNKRELPFASAYMLLERPELILEEGGYHEFPFLVPRWTTYANEVYGRGPGWTALPDIRSLNRAVELYLAAAGKAIDPPLIVDDDGVIGTLTLEPAGVNVVRRDARLEVLESKARFDVAELLNERLERKISEMFYTDALRLRFKPEMTATEVIALQEEMLRLLGPSGGRLLADKYTPMIERTLGILERAGELPPTPDILLEIGGELDIEYEGPLARAQKSADLRAIERVNLHTSNLVAATQRTDLWDNFDLDAQLRHYAMLAGQPAHLNRDERMVIALREARAEAQAQMEKLNAMMEGAKSLGAAAPMVKALQPEGAAA